MTLPLDHHIQGAVCFAEARSPVWKRAVVGPPGRRGPDCAASQTSAARDWPMDLFDRTDHAGNVNDVPGHPRLPAARRGCTQRAASACGLPRRLIELERFSLRTCCSLVEMNLVK